MTVLRIDGILAVAQVLGVQTLPATLAVYPSRPTVEGDLAARAAALAELSGRGVIGAAGEVDDELSAAMSVLARPESELVARICRDGALERVCIAWRGHDHAVAVRRGDDLEVRTLWVTAGDSAALARPILDALGPCPPAELIGFSAPSDELAQRLDGSDDGEYAQALYAVGMPERDALGLGLALRECHATTEIVAYRHGDGVAPRSPMAVGVYDTARGRIVASGSCGADNRTWSTFAPGTDYRMRQAIANLAEWLSEGRSMP